VRYIGNKTKLLPFIGKLLDELHVPPGRSLDAFAGTAAVGSFLKNRGHTVVGCDLMTFSYVLQRAYVVADVYPAFTGLTGDPDVAAARARSDFAGRVDVRVAARAPLESARPARTRPLAEILVFLDSYLDPLSSFVSRHFAVPHQEDLEAVPAARDGGEMWGTEPRGARAAAAERATTAARMYFTLDTARRIDAVRHRLHDWRAAALVSDDEYFVLLAALLEGADAVANTTGIYAAYMKQWQPNALRTLRLRLPVLTTRSASRRSGERRSQAHQGDVSALAPALGHFDLLYLDPPYNTRQYSAYYHIPELIARGWFDETPVLRGKTGLLSDTDKKSVWSTRAQCVPALEQLVASVDADRFLLSYNSEGIIPDAEIERIFRAAGRARTFVRVSREYPRYRSDRPSAVRRYKARTVAENLYYVQKK
jgi:adenine-specific DNA-methyltransferase